MWAYSGPDRVLLGWPFCKTLTKRVWPWIKLNLVSLGWSNKWTKEVLKHCKGRKSKAKQEFQSLVISKIVDDLDFFPNDGLKIQKKDYRREEHKKLSSELEQVTRWPYLFHVNRAPSHSPFRAASGGNCFHPFTSWFKGGGQEKPYSKGEYLF